MSDVEIQLKSGMNMGAYAQSFGLLNDRTVYSDPAGFKSLAEHDLRPQLKSTFERGASELKAFNTTTGGVGTAGFAMIPVYVDPKIIDQTRKYTPLIELIPRVSNQGITADYNNITAKGGGQTAVEDAALSETNDTYGRNSTAIKYLYAVGRVTGQSQAAVPPYMVAGFNPTGSTGGFANAGAGNAMQLEILVKTRTIRELEENLIVNGDVGSDATQYSGIIALMAATNTVDKNTSAMTLDDIQTAIKNAFDDGGRPNLSVCSSGVYTDLLKLLTAKIGYLTPTKKVFWGFETIVLNTMVGEIPVIPSMFMSNVSGSKAIYFLDMSVIEMRVLQDLTFERLAKTNDSEKFMLKIYEALIIRNTAFCSSITEISA